MRHTFLLAVAFLVSPLAQAEAPPRSVAPPKEVVDDEFIGYLFALLQKDLDATITGDELRSLFPEYEGGEITPMDFIHSLDRRHDGDERTIRLEFQRPVEHPAPIDILGHKPVMLFSTEVLGFREEFFGADEHATERFGDAYVLYLEEGTFSVDFATWLDFLLGAMVDDISVSVVLAISFDERWYGVAAGRGNDDDIVTSVYDMPRGRFLARPPREVADFAIARLQAHQD
ncbi:MAG: hypothetical protein ACOC2D_15645 [Spirochaetota bacterium]